MHNDHIRLDIQPEGWRPPTRRPWTTDEYRNQHELWRELGKDLEEVRHQWRLRQRQANGVGQDRSQSTEASRSQSNANDDESATSDITLPSGLRPSSTTSRNSRRSGVLPGSYSVSGSRTRTPTATTRSSTASRTSVRSGVSGRANRTMAMVDDTSSHSLVNNSELIRQSMLHNLESRKRDRDARLLEEFGVGEEYRHAQREAELLRLLNEDDANRDDTRSIEREMEIKRTAKRRITDAPNIESVALIAIAAEDEVNENLRNNPMPDDALEDLINVMGYGPEPAPTPPVRIVARPLVNKATTSGKRNFEGRTRNNWPASAIHHTSKKESMRFYGKNNNLDDYFLNNPTVYQKRRLQGLSQWESELWPRYEKIEDILQMADYESELPRLNEIANMAAEDKNITRDALYPLMTLAPPRFSKKGAMYRVPEEFDYPVRKISRIINNADRIARSAPKAVGLNVYPWHQLAEPRGFDPTGRRPLRRRAYRIPNDQYSTIDVAALLDDEMTAATDTDVYYGPQNQMPNWVSDVPEEREWGEFNPTEQAAMQDAVVEYLNMQEDAVAPPANPAKRKAIKPAGIDRTSLLRKAQTKKPYHQKQQRWR